VAVDIATPGGSQMVIDRVGERFGVPDILSTPPAARTRAPAASPHSVRAVGPHELNLNLLTAVRLDLGCCPP
jgi:hypothetical protein